MMEDIYFEKTLVLRINLQFLFLGAGVAVWLRSSGVNNEISESFRRLHKLAQLSYTIAPGQILLYR